MIIESTCKIVSSLTTLTTPIYRNTLSTKKTTWKVILSLTTLKNSFITDSADYVDIQDFVKNSSIIGYDDYANF